MSKSTKIIAGLGVVAALGISIMPFAGAFALDPTAAINDDSANTEVEVIVDSAIALSLEGGTLSQGKVSVHMDTSDKDETMNHNAVVSTNDTDGYTLSVKSTTASAALVNGSYHINPVGEGGVVAGTEAWGIKGGDLTNYTAVPGSGETALTVKTHSNSTAANESTNIIYGVSTRADQETGTYSNTITYTAAVR